jgi:hypothetical protein
MLTGYVMVIINKYERVSLSFRFTAPGIKKEMDII